MSKTTDTDTMLTMLTVRQIADEANVHPQTVRRWIEGGELPASRFGSGPQPPIRVQMSDWAAFKSSSEVAT